MQNLSVPVDAKAFHRSLYVLEEALLWQQNVSSTLQLSFTATNKQPSYMAGPSKWRFHQHKFSALGVPPPTNQMFMRILNPKPQCLNKWGGGGVIVHSFATNPN